MRLYIAEKKDVATAIVAALGNRATLKKGYYELAGEYWVSWCSGHLLSLTDPEDHNAALKKWTLDTLPLSWKVDLKPIERTKHQLHTVWKLLGEASQVISCTDPDAAGQRIFDEVYNTAQRKPDRVDRALINDNNPSAILRELNNLQPNSNFHHLYLEDLARSVSDQRLGYNMTRLLTAQSKAQGANVLFTVGRVQSAILGLVVMRERNKKNHESAIYYTIGGDFETSCGKLQAKLAPSEDHGLELDHEGRFVNSDEVFSLNHALMEGSAALTQISRKTANDSPTLPHDLLSLQVEASRLFGIKPDETLAITQTLRDKQAITYNRCGTRYLTNENHSEAGYVLGNLAALDQYKWINQMDVDPKRKSRAFNPSKTNAHHAMMPTGNVSAYDQFSQDERRIFALIARQFIIQFFPKRQREVTTYSITVTTLSGNKFELTGKSSRTIDLGWEKIFEKDKDAEGVSTEEENNDIDTRSLLAGMPIKDFDINCSKQTTKPAPSYNMETLLKDLQNTAKYLPDSEAKRAFLERDSESDENGGVGTPATRSDIIKKLFDAGLIVESEEKKPKITPTEKGYALHDLLPSKITSPELTALWAEAFKQIKTYNMEVQDFWDSLDLFIAEEVHRVKTEGLKLPDFIATNTTSKHKSQCPLCSTELAERTGKYGNYYRCDDCSTNFQSHRHQLVYKLCEKCSSPMKLIKTKKKQGKGSGMFFGCSNYPDCKHTEPHK